jgi:hypothetical protein
MMLIIAKELLKGVTNDPTTDGTWVMRGNTDYTYFMIPVRQHGTKHAPNQYPR